MSAPVHTIQDFVNVVRRSGLVEDAPLDDAVARWPDRGQPLPDELPAALVAAGLLTQWQADQLRKGRHRGFVLGKYKLLRLLGSGGMSRVYLADHIALRGKVAIKVLPAANVEKTSYLARFEREARAVFGLNHPNIVRTLDLDTSGPVPFFALEYVDGIDLHNKVKREGPQSLRDAADYVRQAALGLQYAHQESVVHRDIKPANLMLDRHGTVKILDFGLALAGDQEGDSLTREHDEKVLGTADYLAPEQALDSHKADSRSDIYALGCTLFYLLAGRPPFPKGTLAERIQAHQKQPAPRLRDERQDVPHAIDEICSRMLEKHPDARPQSAREVAESLDAWLRTAVAAQGAGRPELSRTASLRRGAAAEGSGPGVSSSDIDSGAPPGQPGCGSGIDSGVIPAAGSGGRATVKLPSLPRRGGGPPAARPATNGGESLAFDIGQGQSSPPSRSPVAPRLVTASSKAETSPDRTRPRKKPAEFAGLPVGFWVVAAAGLLLAGVLGFMVLRPKPKKPRGVKESTVEESVAPVQGEADDQAPDAPDADAKSSVTGDEAAAEAAVAPSPKPGRTPPPEAKGNKPAKPAEPAAPGPLDNVNLAPKEESPEVPPGDDKADAPAEKSAPAAGAKPE